MPGTGRVYVDARREGKHGIARFGTEVVRRMRTPFIRLGGPADALSPLDLANPSRLRLRRDDVVFSPGFHCGPTRARQLITLHDLIQLQDPVERDVKKDLYYRHVVRPAVLHAGRVLTVSETSKAVVSEWVDDTVQVVDVGNGCSDVFFETSPSDERSGLLYVGALKPHKNPAVAFATLAALPDTSMTVVTADVAEAARLAEQHTVTERVTIRTGVADEELAGLYARSSALLFPSLSEGFGLPAAEALAVGCPVIHWSGCAAVAEIVQSDGIAVDDADDPSGWVDAASAALEGRARPDAAARIRARYSWDAVAARVDEQIGEMRS